MAVNAPKLNIWQRFTNVAVPVSAGVLSTMSALEESNQSQSDPLPLIAFIIGIGMAVALRWRRRQPVRSAAFIGAGTLLFAAIAPHALIPWAGGFAVYSLAAQRPLRISLPFLLCIQASVFFSWGKYPIGDLYFVIACLAVAWALGEASRNRRHAFDEEARRMLADERARISRELHDVLAHSVSVIVVQASAADDVFESNPTAARQALRDIEVAGRGALNELRSLLSSVGSDENQPDDRPQPKLSDLDELVETLERAGLVVTVQRDGEVRDLPAGVELAAFRIVQEALTNALRHSAAREALVTLDFGTDTLGVEINNAGPRRPGSTAGSGRGLAGMRERVAMLGGTIETSPRDDGGFVVQASLPIGGQS
jgi:signal transduction histidine kinase